MSTTAPLLTVAEYERTPNPASGIYELHHGVLVLVPPSMFRYAHAASQLAMLLRDSCGSGFYAQKNLSFCPQPEYEVWTADVGMTVRERVRAIREGWLRDLQISL